MAAISADSIYRLLIHIKNAHSEAMPAGAQTLLQALIDCKTDALHLVSDDQVNFDKAAVQAGNPGASDDSLRKRVQLFNQYVTANGLGLKLKSRKSFYVLDIDEAQFELLSSQTIEALSKRIATEYAENPSVPPALQPEPTVFVSHKWHQDAALRKVFTDFCQKLDLQLSHPPEGKPVIKLFYSTSQANGFKPYSDRPTQQDSWCQQAFLGLVLWSQLYDHSNDCQCELGFFIDEQGSDQSGKKAIALLDHGRLNDMPHRLKERNAFFYPADNEISLVEYWEEANSNAKLQYIAALCDRVYEAYAEFLATSAQTKQEKEQLAYQLIKAGAAQSEETLRDKKTQQPEAYEERERIELIPVLSAWANDFSVQSTRVSVLLGDFGFGKTVSCRLLNKELSDAYQENPEDALLPLYLDLKALQADIAEHKSKPIEHLLEAMLQKTGEKLTVSGEDIIQYIRTNRCLVIFDGFDEIGHHLNEAEQQAVYASLLDIIPRTVYYDDAERLQSKADCPADAAAFPSKLLISCRTHFFNRLRKEESFLSGSARHAIGAQGAALSNIRRFYMAPFSIDAIEKYLCALFGEKEGQKAKAMLSDIHDLSELSSHPIMLDLITRQLPQLQARQQAGEKINSAVLYLNLFESIGERDTGKHKIRLSDKQEVLAALALHLWRRQQSSISIKSLDRWFADYAAQHRTIKHQLSARTDAMQVLMQDLCNASLLVREADNYRFAHTSYLEFFRALGVFEAIRVYEKPDCFDVIVGSSENDFGQEALQFLINWRVVADHEERDEFDEKFKQLLESNSNLSARKLGFSIWKYGQLEGLSGEGFPHSSRSNWSGLRFQREFVPESLRHLDYSNLNLSDCWFHLIRFNRLQLREANFSRSKGSQVYFHDCCLDNSQWEGSKIDLDSFWPKSSILEYSNFKSREAVKIKKYGRHTGCIENAKFNNDGKYILSTSLSNSIKIWNSESGECILALEGHTAKANKANFNSDSSLLVSPSDDKTLKVWNVKTGVCIANLEGHTDKVNAAVFSSDDAYIASVSKDQTVKIWDTKSFSCISTIEGHAGEVKDVIFNRNGSNIISASSDGTVRMWSFSSGKCINLFRGNTGHFSKTEFTSVSINNDETLIAAGSGSIMGLSGGIRIWDIFSGNCISIREEKSTPVNSVVFHNDGKSIVSASGDMFGRNGALRVWDAKLEKCLLSFSGHSDRVNSAFLSPDGKKIVSTSGSVFGGISSFGGSIKFWDAKTGECQLTIEKQYNPINDIKFSRDGSYSILASGCELYQNGRLEIYKSNSVLPDFKIEGEKISFSKVDFNSNSSLFASVSFDRIIKIWNFDSRKKIKILSGHLEKINDFCFSFDGKKMASGSDDKSVKYWCVNSGRCIKNFEGHSGIVNSVSISENDEFIVSGANDNEVRVWSAKEGKQLFTLEGHTGGVNCVAFADGSSKVLSASDDGTIRVWSVQERKCLFSLSGHTAEVNSICLNKSHDKVASASSDGTVKVWDLKSAKCLLTLEGHGGSVSNVTLNEHGSEIFSMSDDNTLRTWDLQSGELLKTKLYVKNGEIVYRGNDENMQPLYIQGDAWKYCFSESEGGEVLHPSNYKNWGEIYEP